MKKYIIDDKQLLSQWNYEKNIKTPEETTVHSNLKAWWTCKIGHSFEKTICDHYRMASRNCPYCSGRKFLIGFNDLESKYPEIAIQFDSIKSNILPSEVNPVKGKEYWWFCVEGHSHKCRVDLKVRGKGCGVCNGRQVEIGVNDFETFHPDLAKELNVEKSGITAKEFSYGSSKKKYWWMCNEGHEYQSTPVDRHDGNGCPFCSGREFLAGFNDLLTRYPELSKEFDSIKNNILPEDAKSSGDFKYWWTCEKEHSYYSSVGSRAYNKNGCHYCSNHKLLTGFNDLSAVFPEIASELDEKKSGFKSSEVLYGSSKMAYWNCRKCSYQWKTKITNRTNKGRFSSCHACAGKIVVKGKNDLLSQKPNVASILLEEKSGFYADEVSYGSRKKAWWKCSNCDREWKSEIRKRIAAKNPIVCSNCSGKRSSYEIALFEYIQQIFSQDIEIITNSRQIIKPYELDIYIPELRKAVEFNGDYWHSDTIIRRTKGISAKDYHQQKMKLCNDNNIDLVFVWESDWLNNSEIVKKDLRNFLLNDFVNDSLIQLEKSFRIFEEI